MFTGRKLLLSEFRRSANIEVVRDCYFVSVGKIGSRFPNRLVFAQEQSQVFKAIETSGIAGIITKPELSSFVPLGFGLAISENPGKSIFEIHRMICGRENFTWATFPTDIHPSVYVGPGAYIAEHDVIIRENVRIGPNAVIYPRTIIEKGSSIGASVVVGQEAFEVDRSGEIWSILPQGGGVHIGENVDIQANCTIVRATFWGFTTIGNETKFDCMVHFAHDSWTGRRVRIAACAEISGRVTIEDEVFVGPNASISNGVTIGRGAHITIGSVVTKDVPEGCRVTGNFAIPHEKWIAFMRWVRR
jgi:UDP-3-O-[3-hydroxymyristoyl] glucosamine N-acyltransferase